MTIQPSVLIWTIICFCVLMLILNKMLFGPMLKVMDVRQEKIQRAKDKQKADELAVSEALSQREEALTEAKRQQLALQTAAAEQAREAGSAALEEARKNSSQELEAYAQELEQEARELKTKLDAKVDSLAVVFADRLAS